MVMWDVFCTQCFFREHDRLQTSHVAMGRILMKDPLIDNTKTKGRESRLFNVDFLFSEPVHIDIKGLGTSIVSVIKVRVSLAMVELGANHSVRSLHE